MRRTWTYKVKEASDSSGCNGEDCDGVSDIVNHFDEELRTHCPRYLTCRFFDLFAKGCNHAVTVPVNNSISVFESNIPSQGISPL